MVIGGLRDGPCTVLELSRKELVEARVIVWVLLLEFTQGVLEFKALDKGSDVLLALGIFVLLAHLHALVLKELLRSLPVKSLLLFRAKIQQVHPKSDNDAHVFPRLLACLS